MEWSKNALQELEQVPRFVRSMAKSAIEKFAREQGCTEVTVENVLAVKDKYFGMLDKSKDKAGKSTKVAVVRCSQVSETCAGVGCLKAWNRRQLNFSGYGPDDELIGFFTCGGCSGRRAHRLLKKLRENYDLDVVHLSSCMLFEGDYPKCPFKELIKRSAEGLGLTVVEGTHH